jgi:hypothetical protein
MDQFHDWTRLSRDGKYADCVCKCGTRKRVLNNDLVKGKSKRCKSCGTAKRWGGTTKDQRLFAVGTMVAASRAANTTHGLTSSPEHRIWIDMRRRCHRPQRPDYHRYGGRGIVVCDRWRNDFAAFYADMGPRPEGHTLERKDNDGPYSPDNCKWVPRHEQDHNRRTSHFVVIDGVRMTSSAAAASAGLSPSLVLDRLKRGWSSSELLIPPLTPQENMARRYRSQHVRSA